MKRALFIKTKRTILLTSLMLSGCATSVEKNTETYIKKNFTAPLNQPMEVETGDSIYTAGSYIEGKYIRIKEKKDTFIPGMMLIPFPISIDIGNLQLTKISGKWDYYCAEKGKANASFPGIGSVIRDGDCVGIRVSHENSEKEWVVDNSNYNHSTTIWSKSIPTEEAQTLKIAPSERPFRIKNLATITFNGYHSKQLHFTYTENYDGEKSSKDFTFDFNGDPIIIGVRGNLIRVIEVNPIKMRYEWVKIREVDTSTK